MISIVIADDQAIILDGLSALLGSDPEVRIVGRASNGAEAVEKAKELKPDVVLMDISMPEMDGIEATKALHKCCSGVRVLVLSMYDHPDLVREIFESGASGYILKNVPKEELSLALRMVVAGEQYIGQQVKHMLAKDDRFRDRAGGIGQTVLSKREREVVQLICMEFNTQEIAEKLFISAQTVDTHRKNIMSKLDVKNAAGVVKYAMERGWC
ncbi:MAG: response regulator transcription factor [Bacteroidetes bacterium]|nr:response regulator transcription factor [Bacteroidota bacterium]